MCGSCRGLFLPHCLAAKETSPKEPPVGPFLLLLLLSSFWLHSAIQKARRNKELFQAGSFVNAPSFSSRFLARLFLLKQSQGLLGRNVPWLGGGEVLPQSSGRVGRPWLQVTSWRRSAKWGVQWLQQPPLSIPCSPAFLPRERSRSQPCQGNTESFLSRSTVPITSHLS